jgi:hypothetical protein
VKFSNQKINGTRVVRLNRQFSKSQLSSQVGRTEQKAKEKIIADGTAEIKKVKRKNLKRKTKNTRICIEGPISVVAAVGLF